MADGNAEDQWLLAPAERELVMRVGRDSCKKPQKQA
jgi:hypothetical protein